MAPKVPSSISCSSTELLEHELSIVRAGLELTETEDTWDRILNALLRLNALTVGSAAEYPSQLILACKGFVRPIINSLNSERSRLSGCATDLLATLATHLGRPFEALIPLFVPTLLSLASRSNKIFIARAKSCLMVIVENCQSPLVLPLLRHAVSDKSATLRLTATELVVACLNCFNPPDLETPKRVDDIEAVIRATARDTSADVRKGSRKAFEAYKVLFPARLDAFVAPLTPTMRKYLDIKSAPAKQRKPLPLLSSTSAPSLPSSSQSSDILSRSQPPIQGQAKATTTSSSTFTRVEKTTKTKTKPSNNAPVPESVSMPPPPPPQKKSSSGPVRPPPSMREAIAAAAAAVPSRPLLNRHASRAALLALGTSAAPLDMSKSQPITRGGAQRPEKTPSPPTTSPTIDAAKSIPDPVDAEPASRARSTTGPRRVPKQEPVPVLTADAAPAHKEIEALRESTKERGTKKEHEMNAFTSSTSSATSTHPYVPVFSRPPSRLASSTSSKTGEEEKGKVMDIAQEKGRQREKKKEKEVFKRPESRAGGEFRPRPTSRMENESHKRLDSKDQELYPRPASRMEGEVHPRVAPKMERPASRMEGETRIRDPSKADRKAQIHAESRAEAKSSKMKKKALKQVDAQHPRAEVQSNSQPTVPADREEPKKTKRDEQARTEVRAAAKRSKEERATKEKPSKKRRAETKETEASQQPESKEGMHADTARQCAPTAPQLMPTEDAVQTVGMNAKDENQNLAERQLETVHQGSSLADGQLQQETLQDTPLSQNDDAAAEEGAQETPRCSRILFEGSLPVSDEAIPVQKGFSNEKTPTRPVEPSGTINVRPLAICKSSAGSTPSSLDADRREENAYTPASDLPSATSPPRSAYPSAEFVTPAPLRQAVASSRQQVPQTPISKLLVSIQRGFDPDFSIIGEESEADITPPCAPAEEQVCLGESTLKGAKATVDEDTVPGFVDTRPRKLKAAHGKVRSGHAEERAPLTVRAENRQ